MAIYTLVLEFKVTDSRRHRRDTSRRALRSARVAAGFLRRARGVSEVNASLTSGPLKIADVSGLGFTADAEQWDHHGYGTLRWTQEAADAAP